MFSHPLFQAGAFFAQALRWAGCDAKTLPKIVGAVVVVLAAAVAVVRQGILHQTSFMDPELQGALANLIFKQL